GRVMPVLGPGGGRPADGPWELGTARHLQHRLRAALHFDLAERRRTTRLPLGLEGGKILEARARGAQVVFVEEKPEPLVCLGGGQAREQRIVILELLLAD